MPTRIIASLPAPQPSLRCRAGDLVVVIAKNVNFGRFGTVRRPLTQQEVAMFPRDVLHWVVDSLGSGFNVTDANNTRIWTSDHVLANDAELRPLRDGNGKDEILRITGKPKKARAPNRRTSRTGEC